MFVTTALAAAVSFAAIDRGGITRGIIESTQPFTVAGTEFDTSQAVVTIAGVPGTVAALGVGQIVTVRSEFNGMAVAGDVVLTFPIVGAIEAIDRGGITLLGQTVRIDSQTLIGNSTLFLPGQRVAVTGFLLPDNSTLATRIDLADQSLDRVTGQATSIADDTLIIEGLTVDFSDAELSGFDGQPAEGDRVAATGQLDAPGLLVAQSLTRVQPLPPVEPGDEADIDGFVTRFVSVTDFDVDGVPFTTDADTEFGDGTVLDLVLGARVSVDGVVVTPGAALLAESIEFENGDDGDEAD